MDHGGGACQTDEVLPGDPPDLLHSVELQGHLLRALRGDDPSLPVLLDYGVFHIGPRPEADLSEDGLGTEGGRHEEELPLLAPELQEGVLLGLGQTALGYVGLARIHGDGAVDGAEGGVVRLLDQQALLLQLGELPLDELPIVGIQGAGEPPPVGEEAEPLPIVVLIDVVEEVHHIHGLLELVDLLLGASVPQKIVDGLLVLPGDLAGEGDGPVPGGMGPHGEEDVVSGHPLVPAEGVGVRVSPEMSNMEVSGKTRVCEDQHELGFPVLPLGLVQFLLSPFGLPLLLHLGVVAAHLFTFL